MTFSHGACFLDRCIYLSFGWADTLVLVYPVLVMTRTSFPLAAFWELPLLSLPFPPHTCHPHTSHFSHVLLAGLPDSSNLFNEIVWEPELLTGNSNFTLDEFSYNLQSCALQKHGRGLTMLRLHHTFGKNVLLILWVYFQLFICEVGCLLAGFFSPLSYIEWYCFGGWNSTFSQV